MPPLKGEVESCSKIAMSDNNNAPLLSQFLLLVEFNGH